MTDAKTAFTVLLQSLYEESFLVRDKASTVVMGQVNPIIDQFNEVLRQTRQLYPDKEGDLAQLRLIERAEPSFLNPDSQTTAREKVQEAYLGLNRLGVILGIHLEKPQSEKAPLVVLTVTQQVSQFVSLDFDQLIQVIQQQRVEQQVKTEAEEAVKQFREELSKSQPEPSKLKSYLTKVAKVGREFALPLLMKLLDNWDKIFPPN